MKLTVSAGLPVGTLLFLAVGCSGGGPTGPSDEPASSAAVQSGRLVEFEVTTLPTLGGSSAAATAINRGGVIVGWSEVTPGNSMTAHAVLWRDGRAQDLGTLGGVSSNAWDISDSRIVVGASQVPGSDWSHAFRWRDGVMEDLGTLGGEWSVATSVNDAGIAVGASEGTQGWDDQHAVVWKDGEILDLGLGIAYGVNNRGQVVGYIGLLAEDIRAFLWSNGTMTDLGTAGFGWSWARDINEKGEVVGCLQSPGEPMHAFLWKDGVMEVLGEGCAGSISNRGFPVGSTDVLADPRSRAVMWVDGIPQALSESPTWTWGADSNERGQVVGHGYDDTFYSVRPILWTPRRSP